MNNEIRIDQNGYVFVNGMKFCKSVGDGKIEIPYRKRKEREARGETGAVIGILELVRAIAGVDDAD